MSNAGERESRIDPIDVHVGQRIRLRRNLLGLSQEKLGEALGLTFQQVQKYERGVNRVGASRLHVLAQVLDVPVGFFYDDLPATEGAAPVAPVLGRRVGGFADTQEGFGDDAAIRKETQELVRAYGRITDAAVRKRLVELVKSMAPAE